MKRIITVLIMILSMTQSFGQPPSFREPQIWRLSFDSAQFFEDLDTTYTSIEVNPTIISKSVYPNGRSIELDLMTPSLRGMEFNLLIDCDEPYVDLLGGELLHGGFVMHFECGEGWNYTFLITEWSPVAKVIVYYALEEGRMGMMFDAKLTIEPIEVAEQTGP
jgi:hypothetical protein